MSCVIMKLEPLAALANAVEARLNCNYNYWGFDVSYDLACALHDCLIVGYYSEKKIFDRLYALNVRAYNSYYKNHEVPADESAPPFDVSRYVIHHGPTYRDHGFAVCPWHLQLARVLDFWLYHTSHSSVCNDPLRVAMKEFQFNLYAFIVQNDAQYRSGRWGDLPMPKVTPAGCINEEETTPDKLLWEKLKAHAGHSVSITTYGYPDIPADVCLECEDCGCVILDAETHTISAKEDLK